MHMLTNVVQLYSFYRPIHTPQLTTDGSKKVHGRRPTILVQITHLHTGLPPPSPVVTPEFSLVIEYLVPRLGLGSGARAETSPTFSLFTDGRVDSPRDVETEVSPQEAAPRRLLREGREEMEGALTGGE